MARNTAGFAAGLVDFRVCALDEDRSGRGFQVRKG